MPLCNLPEILANPKLLQEVSLCDWDRLLPWARRVGIVAKFYTYLEQQGQIDGIPLQVQPHLEAASIIATEHERRIRWECNRIQRALFDLSELDFPVILLKGAAYVMASLPCAHGRLVSDVDIMVPKSNLTTLEQILQKHGWESVKNSDYDQHYYRQWMHELPPLRHRLRGTLLDVHHAILPETSRLKPDPTLLTAASRPLPNTPFRVFCPADMVLHSAAHAFQEELGNPLRDLLDLHELLTYFSTHEPDLWEILPQRAQQLHLSRPLFYALRYTRHILDTPVPESVIEALKMAGPSWPILRIMDRLIEQVAFTEHPRHAGPATARWLLYIRSHWLRMPPSLLARHLGYKAYLRWRPASS
ncbi:MAG: nucleotidyltransferase family protein [Gammaproteobacteria bacterium]|nr:nucleotidyltransferase family protein [Gammaproteobacteria bacterium]MCP5196349.1 nucleotidyltransferase family protein [Gammaproteobacteria bacterium]